MNNAAIPQTKSDVELLTPRDMARVLRTTPQTVNNWHRQGIIPATIAMGRIVRFDAAQVLDALAAKSTRHQEVAK